MNKKLVTIIVNATEHSVEKDDLTFEEIVALAFNPVPQGPNVGFAITYRRGQGNKPEGNLNPGESVKVKDGMIINVTPTDRS
jgi:hypothetical protein